MKSIDQIREDLRSSIFEIVMRRDGAEDDINYLNLIYQSAGAFVSFGLKSGLMEKEEAQDWQDVIWGRRLLASITEKYMSVAPNEDFLAEVYARTAAGCKDRDAVSFIFDHISDLMTASKMAEVDAILFNCDVSKLDTTEMLSFMTITNGLSLPSRPDFQKRVWARSLKLVGRSETKQLFGGFDKESHFFASSLQRLLGHS